MTDAPLLEIRSLAKSFGGARALRGVDFELRAGEVHALLGENGAGKSTLIKIVTGAHQPDAGVIRIGGREVSGLDPAFARRLGIACIYQQPALFPDLTVAENILAVLEATGVPAKVRAARVEAHLAELHLGHVARQKAFTLSGGERRRLEIARALVTRPKFLLMDEPFAAIDPISVAEVQRIILQLKARGIGVVITDHNVRETLRIVDRAYLIHEGKVLTEGPGEFLIRDEQARRFYLGDSFKL